MKAALRDVLGLARVERQLGLLRERWAEQTIAGTTPAAAQRDEDEAQAVGWRSLREPAARLVVGDGPDGPATDGGRLGLATVLAAHRQIAALPLAGDPAHAEPL